MDRPGATVASATAHEAETHRAGQRVASRIVLTGHVQGVGFRPFVYRIARELGLNGWVQNQLGQVAAHVEGPAESVAQFAHDVIERAPPLSSPALSARESLEPEGFSDFEILTSSEQSEARVFVPPDYFTCRDCLDELVDPDDRRYRYPFINCTQCGPRYTLITRMPYDRPNTTMAGFQLCDDCLREYEDPLNRRFHAEPVACPACGPQLEFREGALNIGDTQEALDQAVAALQAGRIVAVKGVGGYHLMCDARSPEAVQRLRARKHRPDKPLAVMFPAKGKDEIEALAGEVQLTPGEASLVASPMRPIVLCRRDDASQLAPNIAPGLGELGVFLPYSPLHHLLLAGFGGSLVATSGNLSGEPVLTEIDDVEKRLGAVADARLHHDRPIVRPADDPVFRSIAGKERPLRLGRGCAPLEISLPFQQPRPVLAVGAHMKNVVALSWADRAVVSPHIGEMDTLRSVEVFEKVLASLQALYGVKAEAVVCDAHGGYTTSRWARRSGLPVTPVLHHHAHASALAGEFGGGEDWLVFTWDGVGYGGDGTLWGGEALHGEPGHWTRVASMRPFYLPGGEKAGREPWRSAAALCWETGASFPDDGSLVHQAWQKRVNTPQTSAVGRLFDAAAALALGIRSTSFEAQGPMQLEALCEHAGDCIPLPCSERADGIIETDWAPLLAMLRDNARKPADRAADFHASMAGALRDQAAALRVRHSISRIGLAGGVFQNRVLTERVLAMLEAEGFEVCLSERLPCNDAGIAYGQCVEHAALAQ